MDKIKNELEEMSKRMTSDKDYAILQRAIYYITTLEDDLKKAQMMLKSLR